MVIHNDTPEKLLRSADKIDCRGIMWVSKEAERMIYTNIVETKRLR